LLPPGQAPQERDRIRDSDRWSCPQASLRGSQDPIATRSGNPVVRRTGHTSHTKIIISEDQPKEAPLGWVPLSLSRTSRCDVGGTDEQFTESGDYVHPHRIDVRMLWPWPHALDRLPCGWVWGDRSATRSNERQGTPCEAVPRSPSAGADSGCHHGVR
jgi:hypothetical protein